MGIPLIIISARAQSNSGRQTRNTSRLAGRAAIFLAFPKSSKFNDNPVLADSQLLESKVFPESKAEPLGGVPGLAANLSLGSRNHARDVRAG